MQYSLRQLSASLCLALLISASFLPLAKSNAQDFAATSPVPSAVREETVMLLVGDILEIFPVHTLLNPQYTWILTQERTFIEASRARTFRKRIIQPGTYTLFAEISAGDQSQRINRTFNLQYSPRSIGSAPVNEATGTGSGITTLVTTQPPSDTKGTIVLSEGQSLVRLTPQYPDFKPLSLDTHTGEDSSGDGNPASDVENDGTLMQTDATPLTLWFATPLTERPMALTAIGPDGTPIVQRITVLERSYAQSQGLLESPMQITATPSGNLTYAFSATFLIAPPASPLLHHWEFGDGQQSILPTPSHTYAISGTYTVSVRIQNLINGSEIGRAQQEINVQGETAAPVDPVVEPEPETPPPEADPVVGDGVSFSMILIIGGVFLGALLFGILLLAIFMKFRGRNLDLSDQFASMEETLLSKDKKDAGEQPSPPLTIPSSATPSEATESKEAEALRKREEERESANPLKEKPLKIDEGNAPSWLKSGLATAPSIPTKPEAAKPAPVPTPPAAPTPPKPVPPPAPPIVPKPVPPPAPPVAPKVPTPPPAPVTPTIPPVPAAPTVPPAPKPTVPPPPTAPPITAPAPQASSVAPAPKPPTPSAPPAAPKPVPPPPATPPTRVNPTPSATANSAEASELTSERMNAPSSPPPWLQPKPQPPPAPKPVPPPPSAPSIPSASAQKSPKIEGTEKLGSEQKPVAPPPSNPIIPSMPTPASEQSPSVVPPWMQQQPPTVTPAPATDTTPSPLAQKPEANSQPFDSAQAKQSIANSLPPDDSPIAFIRAESIEEHKKEEGNA